MAAWVRVITAICLFEWGMGNSIDKVMLNTLPSSSWSLFSALIFLAEVASLYWGQTVQGDTLSQRTSELCEDRKKVDFCLEVTPLIYPTHLSQTGRMM